MISAKMKWSSGIKFEGTSKFGLPIITDGPKASGGEESGYSPMELILFGLAGCTGIDVVRILEKKRQKLTGLEIEVNGYQPDHYPKPFNKIEIKYTFCGEGLEAKHIEQALDLSENKYCAVSQSLSGMASITHSYEIIES